MKTIFNKLIVIITMAAFTTCSTAQRITFPTDLNEYAAGQDFETMNEYVQFLKVNDKYSVYNAKNTISYLMDLGLAEHYTGNYQESSKYLLEAERLIWEAYTKSVGDGFKSFATVNPYRAEYQGEDFENIYINIFCALNFYHMGDIEKALVEVRRVNEKLLYMNNEYERHYGGQSQKVRDSASKIQYSSSSALARYLCVLLWRAIGNMDSARIDAVGLNEAFADSPDLYQHPVPPEMVMSGDICEELSVPAGMARLNFLSFTGFSPYKIPISSFMGITPNVRTLSYRRAPVDRIEVVFDNGQRVNLSLLEPFDTISQQIFETKEAYRRSVWGIHSAGSFMVNVLLAVVTLGFYRGKTDATKNTALDMRMSQLMPGKAYVGGINLPPGIYSFAINYYNENRVIDRRRMENQTVSASGLNFIQDNCLIFEEARMPEKLDERTVAAIPDFPGRLSPPSNFKVEYPETEGVKTATVRWDPVPGALAYYIYTDAWDSFGDGDYIIDEVTVKPWTISNMSITLGRKRAIAVGAGGFSVPSERF